MANLTNGTKLKIQGEDFKVVDLREKSTMWQGDESYYGSKRTSILKAHYSEQDDIEKAEWNEAQEVNNGDKFWIDGKLYVLIVKNVRACDGVMFITDETYNYIKNTIGLVA